MADTIEDLAGRKLQVSPVTVLERRRLMRACGKASDIEVWLGETILACCVRSIDGIPVPFPNGADQADALVARLDKAGLEVVGNWYTAQAAPVADLVADAKN